jgi:hypothetical protein
MSVAATAAAPAGRNITAMRIYLDSNSVYAVNAASLNTSIATAAGSHSLIVQAWDNTGTVYKEIMTVNVGSASAPAPVSTSAPTPVSTPTPAPVTTTAGNFDSYPSTAVVNSHMENATWDSCNCGGTGNNPSSESLTKSASSATETVTGSGSGIAGWLWYTPFSSTDASNWIMDYEVTPKNLSGAVALEFDGNQTGSLGSFVFGTECNYGYNPTGQTVWRFWTMSGGSQTWGTTSYVCPITQVNHTYHVQMHFVASSGSYQVAHVEVTDLTTGAVLQNLTSLGNFSAVGSHGDSIDMQADVKAGSTVAAVYQNVTIIRW